MQHDKRGRAGELDNEIAIADSVQAVSGNGLKAESARDRIAIDRIRSSCQRGRAEWQYFYPLAHFCDPLSITGQHFEISQTPVRKHNRLRALQVGVTRNHRLTMCFGEIEERFLRISQRGCDAIYFFSQPKTQVSGDLIVSAASRIADHFNQTHLDKRMHIFGGKVVEIVSL